MEFLSRIQGSLFRFKYEGNIVYFRDSNTDFWVSCQDIEIKNLNKNEVLAIGWKFLINQGLIS